MFCTQCGSQLEDNARFCTKCGTRVTRLSPEPEDSRQQEQPFYQPNVRGPMSLQTKGLISAAVVVIVGGLLFYKFGDSGGSRQSTPERTVESFIKAVNAKDGGAAIKLFKPDAVPDDKEDLKALIEEFEDNIGDMKVVDYDIDEADIDEDTATVDYEVTFEQDGERDSEEDSFDLILIDERWYIDRYLN